MIGSTNHDVADFGPVGKERRGKSFGSVNFDAALW
jgi:hypothetical protein